MIYEELIQRLLIDSGVVDSKRELKQLIEQKAITYRTHDGCIIVCIGKKKRFVLATKESEFTRNCEKVGVPMAYVFP